MNRHELLRRLHEVVRPRTYLEIGVHHGASMALSRVPSVGVDPDYSVTAELATTVHLARTTSDEFFARARPLDFLPQPVIDLAFIDGMHLSEFVLRDLMIVERFSHPGTVIVLDDVLPRTVEQAGRTRQGAARNGAWAGDVYKVVEALREHRPDLVCVELDTRPTGTVVIFGADPTSTTLSRVYDDLVGTFVSSDPQEVPAEVTERRRALDPSVLLGSVPWAEVRAVRRLGKEPAGRRVREALATAGLGRR